MGGGGKVGAREKEGENERKKHEQKKEDPLLTNRYRYICVKKCVYNK